MAITFAGPAVMSRDMAASRAFYERVLGQEVLFAVGEGYVAYKGGFSLWEFGGAMANIHGSADAHAMQIDDGFELYFETSELDESLMKLEEASVAMVHGVREQPWGQRCVRVRDPEGRLVELGEPMALVAERFLAQGLTPEQTAERTMLPLPMIQAMAHPLESGKA